MNHPRAGASALRGCCHCGMVTWEAHTRIPQSELRSRECSCDFCRSAAPRWWSDPLGELVLRDQQQRLNSYRFGTQTAEFRFCSACGILLAATCEIDGRCYAVLNLKSAEALDLSKIPVTRHVFESEDVAARLTRRHRSWTPARIELGPKPSQP